MRGRKPTPTALKLVQGNPGKRPLNTNEPQPAEGDPSCPSWLTREAKAEWNRWVKALGPTRMLTQADRTALAALCEAWGLLKEAQAEVTEHGTTVFEVERTCEDGTVVYARAKTNPAVRTMLQSMATIRALAVEFGGTPSARSRLHAPEAKKSDPKADLLSS